MGKLLIGLGVILLIVGLLIQFTNFNFSWFGNLPGDIRIEKPGFSVYIPFASMLVLSIVFSLVLWLINKMNS